ncbi:hypothetical protein CARUB_v10020148mg [Capsella rubella]|uniref:Uncharacterized protein n=1 Tax=Capsella rubella TaxID=81985 RepID=R0IEB7_9BRAS|nr:cylicin-2 [Capsella rubella]EOA35043.1 hypothetical protein CARUB_v10020148mg [Capsella rubella]
MPPFRFYIPFFSSNSPSRLSSGTSSSPSPPPTPSPSTRPPFRPAGIAQPSKPETKPKATPSLSRVRSNGAAIAAALSASPSRGTATPTRLAKPTTQQLGSPSKKLESPRKEEKKVTMKEKPSRDTENVVSEKINPVTEKPPIARPEENLERKETDAVQEQRKKTEAEKQAVQEKKKALPEGSGEKKSAADQGQQKRKEIEKLAVQERKEVLHDGGREKSEADQGQQKRNEKEKLALQETKRALQTAGREDTTLSKSTRHMAAASGAPRDLPERETKTQNRTEIHTDGDHQKTKVASTSNTGNPRVTNGQGSSSMSKKIKEDIKDGISKLTWGKSNGDEKSVNVYTLTGENRGATMGISSEKDKKDGEVHIRRGYRSNPDESPNTTATEPEGGRNPKDYDEEKEEARFRAYINGNTQGINNSIIVESSVSENDPGVHMSLTFEKSMKEIINPPEKNVTEKRPETEKVTEKVRNEPRVRRRCLRGLLAESSESEPGNPLKSRRHGCRFTCKDKDIENTSK